MPRYRFESGVVVNIPEEKAERISGLVPLDVPSSPRRRSPRKKTEAVAPVPQTPLTEPNE